MNELHQCEMTAITSRRDFGIVVERRAIRLGQQLRHACVVGPNDDLESAILMFDDGRARRYLGRIMLVVAEVFNDPELPQDR